MPHVRHGEGQTGVDCLAVSRAAVPPIRFALAQLPGGLLKRGHLFLVSTQSGRPDRTGAPELALLSRMRFFAVASGSMGSGRGPILNDRREAKFGISPLDGQSLLRPPARDQLRLIP